jgi:osmotically-inducible protein OsmY
LLQLQTIPGSREDAMDDRQQTLDRMRAALRSEAKVGLSAYPLQLDFANGHATLDGETGSIVAKKLALEAVAALPEVTGIVDRLRVQPATPMGDREIGNHVRDALLQEPALSDCAISVWSDGDVECVRRPDERIGDLDVAVRDGVVTLNGHVPSLARKRLAGVLAWWVPGSRDVINGVAVEPPEDDNDEAITDAVRVVLEKDPFVNASQLRIGVRDAVVTLTGQVPTESEREMAVFDGWYIFGVDKVHDEIAVRP